MFTVVPGLLDPAVPSEPENGPCPGKDPLCRRKADKLSPQP